MTAPIKAILVAILTAAALFILTHLAFFFPFYLTIVTETFNLANVAANDNYVRESYLEDALDRLRERPIFERAVAANGEGNGNGWDTGAVQIRVYNVDGFRAVGSDNPFDYSHIDGASPDKPYRQRGEPIDITIVAYYPFVVTMWGHELQILFPVSFSMTTIGLRYYKDLDYEFLWEY